MSEKTVVMSPSISKLTTALIAAKKEFAPILRDRNNPFFKSKYADLASALEATEPALEKNGLAVSQFPVNELDRIGVLTLLLHESGEFIGREFTLPVAKQDAQTGTAAVTYARRTAYMAALGVAAEDDDGNKAAGNSESEKPAQTKNSTSGKTNASKAASTKAPGPPKAEIPSEPLGKTDTQPGAAVVPDTSALAIVSLVPISAGEGDNVPTEEQTQLIRNRFSLINKDIADGGLKAGKGMPVGRKVTMYLLHRTGAEKPETVTYQQWQKFFDEVGAYKDSEGGFKALAQIIEKTVGGK